MFLKPITKSQYFSATGDTVALPDDKGSPVPPTTIGELDPSKNDPTIGTSPVPKEDPPIGSEKPISVEEALSQTRPAVINVSIDNVPLVSELYPSGKETIVTGSVPPLLGGGFGGGGGGTAEEGIIEDKKSNWWIWLAAAGGAYGIYRLVRKK